MTIAYIILGAIALALILRQYMSKKNNQALLYKRELARTKISDIATISVVETIEDLSPKIEANAKKIIKTFRKPYSIEQRIIVGYPTEFIYFAKFFDSRIRYGSVVPEYISSDDHYRRRYAQAVELGIGYSSKDISMVDILKSLKLKDLNQLSDKKFTRKQAAVNYLLQLPSIDESLNNIYPIDNYFQLKKVQLNMDYLNEQWEAIQQV